MGRGVETSERAAHAAWWCALACACALAVSACPGETTSSASGHPTGATCDTAITYETHIAPLMHKYCTSCHAATLAPEQRHGAPLDHNYDSEISVLEYPEHTTDYAGAGGEGINDAMPPAGWPQPSYADRQMFANYLACYANGGEPPHDHDAGH